MDELARQLTEPTTFALFFVLLGYFAIAIERRREGSTSRDDTQVGLKLVLWALMIYAALEVAEAVEHLLWYVLGGFKGGWKGRVEVVIDDRPQVRPAIREILPHLIAAGGLGAAVFLMLLPRTNNGDKPQIERFALGLVSLVAVIGAVMGVDHFLKAIFMGGKWPGISGAVSELAVWGGLGGFALLRLGQMSGWKVPVRAPKAPMSPPMTGGYPPQGGGYPPQGGGYPPQGGVPPLGGGYPPQGGGYPPQGGQGQGGGGWPPVT
jgi:hypothetical protein